MPYFDRARVEYLRDLGLLEHEPHDPQLVMRAQHVEYHAPARFDDLLDVFVRVARMGTSSMVWEFEADNAGDRAASGVGPADHCAGRPCESAADPRRSRRALGGRAVRARAGVGVSDVHAAALAEIGEIIDRESEVDEIVRQTVEVLHDRIEHYAWVGIYFVEESDLVLGPWRGPAATEHVRIPVGQGVCGAAAASGRTEIVDDVNADPRYLACFLSTRSEIVVPVRYDDIVVAEIDIDSDEPAAFGDGDREFLEQVAELLSPHCLLGWDTGGEPWEP